MDTIQILSSLRNERNRIDQAIAALEALNGTFASTIDDKASTAGRGQRHMSAAGRKRIAEAARKRWAAIKTQQRSSAASTAKKSGSNSKRKPMSAAVKKRLSEQARKRWAERKKAAATA
jgi:hypothetical protein